MYDAAHKNGNIIKPFGQKNGIIGGNAMRNIYIKYNLKWMDFNE